MCGDTARGSQGGALAVLHSPFSPGHNASSALEGRMVFRGRDQDATEATHVTITSPTQDFARVTRCVIGIHETGDLTQSARDSPLFCKLDFKPEPRCVGASRRIQTVQYPLQSPIGIYFGEKGIIGRRVTVWMEHDGPLIGEGIVGCN